MLPDLPKLKNELQEVLDQYLRAQIYKRMGVFNEAPRHIVHEGKSMRTFRADGTAEDSNLHAASAEMTLQMSAMPQISLAERTQQLDKMADDMASQMTAHLFQSLGDSLERAGQVVDRKGRPIDGKAVLAMFEAIHIDYDKNGEQSPLTIVGGSREVWTRAFNELENNPDLKARFESLMQEKERDWRDREAARKLVG